MVKKPHQTSEDALTTPKPAPLEHARLEDPLDLPIQVEVQLLDQGGKERYFLYEHDGDPRAPVEVQWEDSHSAAVESFLLPDLRATVKFPERAEYVGPNGWDLVDPESGVPPMIVAIADGPRTGRFLVGVADWPEGQDPTQAEIWAMLDGNEKRDIRRLWARLKTL